MFKRNVKPLLQKALRRSPVVLLNGARQVGKTTLAKEFLDDKYTYLTLDDEITYLAAKNDVKAFINGIKKPVIIDEVQRIPELFLAIKQDVDTHRIAGNYLLTGSANPLLIPRLGDSLAGRMEIIDLMPLSQGEINGVIETFISKAFSKEPALLDSQATTSLTRESLYKQIIIGGYPGVQGITDEDRIAWMRNYLNLLLQKDIKDLAQIEKLTELPQLLRILAARAANLLNVAEVSRDTTLTIKTTHRYLALLEAIFIVNLLPAWSNNFGSRFIKAPKVYLIDSGLLSYLLNTTLEKSMNDAMFMGKIVENFVVSEIKKQATWSETAINLYHFRTPSGEEIDLILEDLEGNIVGIEVKNSSSITPHDFKNLKYLQERIKKDSKKALFFMLEISTCPLVTI